MEKGRNRKKGFYVSIGMILVGLLLSIFQIHPLGGGLILGGAALFISNLYYTRKPESETIADERIKRINERAGYYAFWIVLLSSTAIYLMSLSDLFEPSSGDLHEIIVLLGLYSWFFLRFYLSKRGLE